MVDRWKRTFVEDFVKKRVLSIWHTLLKDHVWQRMVKNVVAIEITVILGLVPATLDVLGPAAYLAPIVAVFAHPGRRLGALVESLTVVLFFALLGLSWAILGVYCSSLVYDRDPSAAYAIRGVFLLFAVILHGFLRSHVPRIYVGLVFLLVAALVTLLSPQYTVTIRTVTQVLYPVLLALGVNLFVNIIVFPETSSDFLGQTTIETLAETVKTLREAESYFVQIRGDGQRSSSLERNGLGVTTSTDLDVKPVPSHPTVTGEHTNVIGQTARWDRWRGMWLRKIPPEDKMGPPPALPSDQTIRLKDLTARKAKLRARLASCKGAQSECLFELNLSCLPPRELKLISSTSMKRLVANTIALIGACESKFALVSADYHKSEKEDPTHGIDHTLNEPSDSEAEPATPRTTKSSRIGESDSVDRKEGRLGRQKRALAQEHRELEHIKPRREIEFGDARLLNFLVSKIAHSLGALQESVDRSVQIITVSIAFAYDVKHLPSGARTPTGLLVEELDVYVESFEHALKEFDRSSAEALEDAAVLDRLKHRRVDVMPREEIFLISSFILNLRQAATHTLRMLQHCRVLVEQREARRGRKRIHLPHIKWRKWINLGGDEVERHPAGQRSLAGEKMTKSRTQKETVHDDDEESDARQLRTHEDGPSRFSASSGMRRRKVATDGQRGHSMDGPRHRAYKSGQRGLFLRQRVILADALDYLQTSDDVLYTMKLTVATFLVSFPALVPSWNQWYSDHRGIWAAFQLVYVFEVAIGSTITAFLLRLVGTTTGCLWGWAAYEARNGNRAVCAIMIAIGLFPGAYIQLTSRHFKAGQVAIVSMTVVALATELGASPGSGTDIFLKRITAFAIGSTVALLLQVVLLPVKARTRLVRALAMSIHHITRMESCIALGVETGVTLPESALGASRGFDRASTAAHHSLAAAEVFLPFCLTEPRLKGSFASLHMWYTEILFVLHQITDRMDNMLSLRRAYGSSVLEDFNPQIYAYRRSVAGAILCVLCAVHEALTTKLPLPQFLPSARLAYLRMINRVREVVESTAHRDEPDELTGTNAARRRAVGQKFIAWNASSAALAEIVEYLEELVELVKILVGAHEFRGGVAIGGSSGGRYKGEQGRSEKGSKKVESTAEMDIPREINYGMTNGSDIIPTPTVARENSAEDEDVPGTLRRMQTRRTEEKLDHDRRTQGRGTTRS